MAQPIRLVSHDHGSGGNIHIVVTVDPSASTFHLTWKQAMMRSGKRELDIEGKCNLLGQGFWCLRGPDDVLLHLILLPEVAKISLNFDDPFCHTMWAMDAAMMDGSGNPETIEGMLIDPQCASRNQVLPRKIVYFRAPSNRSCKLCPANAK